MRFSAEQFNDDVLVKWTVGLGQTCYTVIIERSLDSQMDFEALYTYPGVCGNANAEENYSYTYSSPHKNTQSFYRLNLGNGFTKAVPVWFVDYGEEGYILMQDIVAHQVVLRFLNPYTKPFSLSVYNLSGQRTMQIENIKSDELAFSTLDFPKGCHVFRLTDNDGASYTGKFIVP